MARETILEINCSRYSERIIDVIILLNKIGWKYYDVEQCVEYLPLGDIDEYDWQKGTLSESELYELVENKQDSSEIVGVNLYYQYSDEGITLLALNTKEIILGLDLNKRTINKTRDSIADISWYFTHIVQKLQEEKCPIDYVKFEDYVD